MALSLSAARSIVPIQPLHGRLEIVTTKSGGARNHRPKFLLVLLVNAFPRPSMITDTPKIGNKKLTDVRWTMY